MNGRGMWTVAAGYGMPFSKQLKGEVNAAYLAAVKRLKSLSGVEEDRKGNDIGTELNAQLTYNITKGLDVSGVGAYAWLGDFLNSKTGSSVKDAWTTYAKINYAY